ncbi:MAG: hypothetical protein IKN83_12180 [Bacteroidaceae bacterium]|nr:hypothetical protein [Bacteroidaceae bacterium]
MKNLKKIFGLLAVLAISLTTSVFTSCGSDDDDDKRVDIQYKRDLTTSGSVLGDEISKIESQFNKEGIKESWSERKELTDVQSNINYWKMHADAANAELLQQNWKGTYKVTVTATYSGSTRTVATYNYIPLGEDSSEKVTIKYKLASATTSGTTSELNSIINIFKNKGIKEEFEESCPSNRVNNRIEYWKAKAALADYEAQQKTWKATYTITFTGEFNNTNTTIGTYTYKAQ